MRLRVVGEILDGNRHAAVEPFAVDQFPVRVVPVDEQRPAHGGPFLRQA